MAKLGVKTVASPSRVAERLVETALYGVKMDMVCPHSIHTWFGVDTVGIAAFHVAFEDLTCTPAANHLKRGAIYDFVGEQDDDVKRMYFLSLAEYHLSRHTRIT